LLILTAWDKGSNFGITLKTLLMPFKRCLKNNLDESAAFSLAHWVHIIFIIRIAFPGLTSTFLS
jgi:hypothetical protein